MNYEIEPNPSYVREIRKLENNDPASAEDTFNPLFSRIVNNIEAVFQHLEGHAKSEIKSEHGVHGLRYYEGEFQLKNNVGVWESAGNSGIPPSNVISPSVKVGNGKLTISWSDPADTIIDGQTVCTWRGTKLVQKIGSFPEDVNDGVLVLDNRERNKYASDGFVVNNLQNGVDYYFQLFPYSDKKAVNENHKNRLKGSPFPFRTMTVKIDLRNSNPATCCTYHDDAVGMSAKSEAWDEFFGHYPCLFKNGHEVGKLKKTDFTKFENDSPADITSGNAGDVMIAFPRRGVRISTEGNIITVSMTDDPDDPAFKYYAHTRGSHKKNRFYLGAYMGYHDGSKLRSLSGKTPTSGQTIGTFRGYARNNGTGYDQSAFYQLTFRQVMYLLKYKHLNSQIALGMGYVAANSSGTSTGGTNTRGMDFAETTGKVQMKLFGLEDFWGNYYEWVDGIYSDSVRNILVGTDNFNDEGAGYTNHGQGATSDLIGWMKKPNGTTEMGFIVKEVDGSETTYFCDCAYLSASRIASFGGYWGYGNDAGAFPLYLYYAADHVTSYLAGRLMYL